MNNFEYAQATDEQLHQWEHDAYDAYMWDQENAQLRWAELGGYQADLMRPGKQSYDQWKNQR